MEETNRKPGLETVQKWNSNPMSRLIEVKKRSSCHYNETRGIILAIGLAQSTTRWQALKIRTVGLAAMAVTSFGLPSLAVAQFSTLGPLVEISLPNPLDSCNDGFPIPGNMTVNDSFEPYIAVNPVNPANIVAIWSGGLIQGAVTGVSFDAGNSWQTVPLPITLCAGGQFLGAADVWVSFSPNGDLYAAATVGQTLIDTEMAVCKSTDGGLHWAPTLIPNSASVGGGHPAITADPLDPHFAYNLWNTSAPGHRGPAIFSRTTDGGLTWEPARAIFTPDPHAGIMGDQICVLPNGSLIAFYELVSIQNQGHCIQQTYTIAVSRSVDRGVTWSAPTDAVSMTPYYDPCSPGQYSVFDPNTGESNIEDSMNPMFAVDGRNGYLYAVWEDGRFTNLQYNQVAFSMSTDGGFTWSAPIRVNKTPLTLSPGNRQAFLPTVAVAADGTIGVSYYDFRFNAGSGLLTDYWLVQCHPTAKKPATDPANWGNEVRVTDTSFNFGAAFTLINLFLGDYMGLAGDEEGFVAAFNAVDRNGHTATFVRRIEPTSRSAE